MPPLFCVALREKYSKKIKKKVFEPLDIRQKQSIICCNVIAKNGFYEEVSPNFL